MAGLVRALVAAEGHDGIRSLTLMHGFPWSDWSEAGASILAVAEEALAPRVEAVAKALADCFVEIATNAPVRRLGVRAAVDAALASPARPVVIADSSDNPGGGAACDSTFLLRELLDRNVENVALGMLWDPQSARIAADAGVGARLPMRLGGKVGPDLTRIGQVRSERDLVEAIVFPSASFARGYEPVVVRLKSGQTHSGLLRSDTADEIVLSGATSVDTRLTRKDVADVQPGTISLMPAGYGELLTRQELADLLAFLRAAR